MLLFVFVPLKTNYPLGVTKYRILRGEKNRIFFLNDCHGWNKHRTLRYRLNEQSTKFQVK